MIKIESAPFQITEIPRLAEEFAARVTPGKVTCAQLQHYVLLHKTKPQVAVGKVAEWIEEEMQREAREQLEKKLLQEEIALLSQEKSPKQHTVQATAPSSSCRQQLHHEAATYDDTGRWEAMQYQVDTALHDDAASFQLSSSSWPSLGHKSSSSSTSTRAPSTTSACTPPSEGVVNGQANELNTKQTTNPWQGVDQVTVLGGQTEKTTEISSLGRPKAIAKNGRTTSLP